MEKITRLILVLITVIVGMYFFLPQKPYIGKSLIQGNGLFAGKNYKKNEVIFENLFPHKDNSTLLFNPIQKKTFDSYILNEGHYINHCSLNKNIDIISDNYRVIKVVAKREIKKHEELCADYNLGHKHLPFIAPALPNYVSC